MAINLKFNGMNVFEPNYWGDGEYDAFKRKYGHVNNLLVLLGVIGNPYFLFVRPKKQDTI